MKRIIVAALLLAMAMLLAGCAAELPASIPDGAPGHASQDIGLTTDGQRVYLLRQGATLRWWSFTFSAYEVTGGGMRRIVSGRDADDFAVAEGRLLVASHTANWLKAVWDSVGIDGYDALTGENGLPDGVLLEGVMYYPAADGVRAYSLEARQDSLFAAVTAPEYFYVTDGWLYTVTDDGLLTAFDLRAGAKRPTAVALTKADRYIIAGETAYILQKPELHGVRQTGCRIEALWEAE